MSSPRGQVLPFPDIQVEITVLWGRQQMRLSDIRQLSEDLNAQGSALVELDAHPRGELELCIGEMTIGRGRLSDSHPGRLVVTDLCGQSGLVRPERQTGGAPPEKETTDSLVE